MQYINKLRNAVMAKRDDEEIRLLRTAEQDIHYEVFLCDKFKSPIIKGVKNIDKNICTIEGSNTI